MGHSSTQDGASGLISSAPVAERALVRGAGFNRERRSGSVHSTQEGVLVDSIDLSVQALEDFVARKARLKDARPLQYLFWEATLRCNLSCRHCGSDCVRQDSSEKNEIDCESIKRELRSIAESYPAEQCTFAIIGGEPLVREEIIDVGSYAASLGYAWGITTNGMLLSDVMIGRLKQANLKTISVSLDGIERDHDLLRNHQGCHRIVTDGIRRLLDDRFYDQFDVICCVNSLNIDHLDEFMEDLLDLGVPAVRFTPVFSRGRAGRNERLMLRKPDYVKLLDFIAKQRATQDAIKVTLSEEGYWGPQWECVVRDELHYCASGILIGTILHDGRVTGCPSVSRAFIEGDIRNDSFVDIWRNGFSRYREDRERTFAHQCAGCEHWVLCEGGGFHLLDQEPGRSACCLELLE
jgi:radical SAM protein with 4Fe4S-binding SPASM domain